MFIKRVIIEGFKSYKEKVVLDGFDDSFNAITGFNGSGKSNILDAICFVLGLSKFDVARCQNLRDFVYKSGKAGITTARVTIELDNSNKIFDKSEWRKFDIISVSRTVNEKNQSKFHLNDRSVTKEVVLELFQSVKLNISNPHFLIMQGKVVKVSAMNPVEILSMVYEAMGATIYETRRRHNVSKIQKCDKIVEEYETTLQDFILPKLKQLKEEEKGLKEYRTIENNIAKMTKINIAYTYLENERFVNGFDDILGDIEGRTEKLLTSNNELESQTEALNGEIEEIQSHLNDETSRELNKAKEKSKEIQSRLDGLVTEQKLKAENLTIEGKKLKSKEKELKEFLKLSEKLEKKLESVSEVSEKLKEQYEESKKRLEQADQEFSAFSKGQVAIMNEDSEQVAASLSEQLQTAEYNKLKIKKRIEHHKVLVEKRGIDIVNIEKEVNANKKSSQAIEKDIQNKEKKIDELKQSMARTSFDESKFDDLAKDIRKCKQELAQEQNRINKAHHAVPMSKYEYAMPDDDFDEKDVYGLICTLFKVEDKRAHMALQKILGGRLFNVVVKNTQTANSILRTKPKERRVFLPIADLTKYRLDRGLLSELQDQYGEENVKYLIDLVSFDDKYGIAMAHCFRNTVICETIEIAREVAFTHNIKTVTYFGETVDPRGYMTTAPNEEREILPIIEELMAAREQTDKLNNDIYELEYARSEMEKSSAKYFQLKKQLNMLESELGELKKDFAVSPYQMSIQRLNRVKADLEDIQNTLVEDEKQQISQEELIANLNDRLANSELYRARDEERITKNKKEAEEALEVCTKKLESDQIMLEGLQAQLESRASLLAALKEELAAFEKNIDEINEQINELNTKHVEVSEKKNEASRKLEELQGQQDAQCSEVANKRKNIEGFKKQISENNIELKKLEIEIDEAKQSEKTAKKTLVRMAEKYEWISEEKGDFTSLESDYRILNEDNFDYAAFQAQYKELTDKKKNMSQKVNLKAVDMSGEQITELDDLQAKSLIVKQDRESLEKFMADVEVAKEEQAEIAWKKVSEIFCGIFSTLLPSATCKLEEACPGNLKKGLVIRVAMAGMWKDSLMELSGGQRSLLALSLILALLKYNPAPLYILDEVDAALDSSHTQNIGIMIKKYFTNSQFIVVSLKEGMFSNANVIFETSFVDGRSYVQRKN